MFQLRARLSINDATQFCFPLVVKLLTFRDADFELDPSAFDINARYYQRHSFGRRRLFELVDLSPMQKEFARAQRIMISTIAVRVRRDVRVEKPSLAFAHTDI